MGVDIGPKIGIQGEQEFRKELKQINEGIKTLGSEMKVVTSEFTNQEKSVESLTKENDVLNRTINSLNDRLNLQKKMLEESAKAYGEADERTQKWQQAVNKTQAEINTATAKIKENEKAMDNLDNEIDDTSESMNEGGKAASSFGDLLKANLASQAIIKGVQALGSAIKGTVKAMTGMVTDAAASADEINTLSKQTGLSTDSIQKFQYAADVIDVPLDTLTGSLSKLTKTMNTARTGSGKAADAFKELGISVTDDTGALRDNEEVFKEIIDALGGIDNETERDAKAMELLGRSAQDLNPLILGGADALEELGKKAEEAGLILSSDELNDLGGIQDAVDEMKKTLEKAGMSIVSTFAEPLSNGINTLLDYVQRLTKAFKEGGLQGLSDELTSLTEDFVEFLTDHIDEIGKFAESVLTTFIDMIMLHLPDLIPAAVSLLTTLGTALIDHVDELVDAAGTVVKSLADDLLTKDNIQKIIDAGVDLLVALVSNTADIITTIADKLPEIIEGIKTSLTKEENIEKMKEAGKKLMKAIVQGMKSAAVNVGDLVFGALGLPTKSGEEAMVSEWLESGKITVEEAEMMGYTGPATTTEPAVPYSERGGGNYYDSALGANVSINLQTPDGDTLANYITPSLGSATKAYGQPLLNPFS